MEEIRTAGIDIDEVCRKFVESSIITYKDYFPHHEVKPITEYGLHPFFPIGDKIYKFLFQDHIEEVFNLNAGIFDGVKDGLEELKNNNIRLIAITSQTIKSAISTLRWIERFELPFNDIYFTFHNKGKNSKKDLIDCDIFIDDNPEFIEQLRDSGKMIICQTRPWNEKFNFNVPRVNNMSEFVSMIKKMKSGE